MSLHPKNTRFGYSRLVLLLSALALYCLAPASVGVAHAQETGGKSQSDLHSLGTTQSTSAPTVNQIAQNRPKARFFESESKLFGAGSFVQSALDGVNNALGTSSGQTAKVNDTTAASNNTTAASFTGGATPDTIQNVTSKAITTQAIATQAIQTMQNITLPVTMPSITTPEPTSIPGNVTLTNLNLSNPNSLNLTFMSPGANVTINNLRPNAFPLTGTVTVNGNITVNGQTIPFNNVTSNYTAIGIPTNNPTTNALSTVSGTITVTNPADPTATFTLVLPTTSVPADIRTRTSINVPAQLTIVPPRGR